MIIFEGIHCIRLFSKYKSEQKAELKAERDKIEAERAETERMMHELMELKAQMEQNAKPLSGQEGSDKDLINGGDFRQVGVPASDPVCDLIYVTGSATVEINGGTFKAVSPERTLNILDADRAKAKIIVKGGSFYKFNPATDNAGEITVPDGYSVIKDGDWYTVIEGTVVNNSDDFAAALATVASGNKIILNCDITALNLADDITVADDIIIDGQGKFSISRDAWMELANLSITIQNAQMG